MGGLKMKLKIINEIKAEQKRIKKNGEYKIIPCLVRQ